MRKLVFTLLLFLASSAASADDLCMSVMSDPDKRPLDRDQLLIVAPFPVYPRSPLTARSEGYVEVEFDITTAGTVRDPIVIFSVLPELFDEAALEGVLKLRYKPRIVDGTPVVVEGVRTRISFSPRAQVESEEPKPARQKKKQAQTVSKKVYDKITKAGEMVEDKNSLGALRILENLLQYDKLNDFERENVLNYIGFVYYFMENISAAIVAYEEMLRIPSMEDQNRKRTLYTLAQLYTLEKRYTNAIQILEESFTLELDPDPDSYILYAQNLYELDRYPETIKAIETAMQIAEMIATEFIKESWYGLLNVAYFQQENFRKVRDIQKILLATWPKELYWLNLAGAYTGLGELQAVLDIWKELNVRWPSDKNSHGLARMYMRLGDKKKALAVFRELLASWPETDYLTPLHLAAAEGDTTLVAELLANGASANLQAKNHRTPLYWAVEFGQAEATKMLIDANADVSLIAYPDRQSEAGKLVIDANVDANAMADEDWTPLHAAANSGDASVVELLIAAGADVNVKAEKELTPLHAAAMSGDTSVADMLIAAGAHVDAKTERDWTPLSYAALDDYTTLAERLIAQGANVAGVEIVAEGGSANAQYLLGSLYEQGRGVRRKNSRAVNWYRTAAEQDNADAAYALGEMYLDGRGIRTNATQAAQWFQAAAYRGHRNAQEKLGELYRNGVGVAKDLTEASMWSCLAGV